MVEQIKDLIEKIQEEGIKAAEERSKEIKNEALQKAAEIVEKATVESHKIISAAKEEAERFNQHTKALLTQAARDMLLGVKKEILAMLDSLVIADIRQALSPEELANVITTLVKDNSGRDKGEIIISLKKEDLEKLGKGFAERLKDEASRGIVLKPSEDILGGFIISYDGGKSHYDFTDKALAEYMGTYLKPALKDILKGAV